LEAREHPREMQERRTSPRTGGGQVKQAVQGRGKRSNRLKKKKFRFRKGTIVLLHKVRETGG